MTINVKKTENHPEHANTRYARKNLSAEEIERFRSLLGDGFEMPMLNNATMVVPVKDTVATSKVAAKAADVTLPPAIITEPDQQILSLRVSTGPLAGMLIQASWQGNKLNLKFSDVETKLSERLNRESGNIGKALSEGFGCPVVIEVENAR